MKSRFFCACFLGFCVIGWSGGIVRLAEAGRGTGDIEVEHVGSSASSTGATFDFANSFINVLIITTKEANRYVIEGPRSMLPLSPQSHNQFEINNEVIQHHIPTFAESQAWGMRLASARIALQHLGWSVAILLIKK